MQGGHDHPGTAPHCGERGRPMDTAVAAASPPGHPPLRRHPLLAGAFVALGILVYLIYILLCAYAFLGSGAIGFLGPGGPLVLGGEIRLAFYMVCGVAASLTRARWLRIVCAVLAHIGALLFTDDHVIGALLLPLLAFSPAWAFLLLEGCRTQLWRDDIPKPAGKQAGAYEGPRCVACEEPIERGAAQCQKCGWTQPS